MEWLDINVCHCGPTFERNWKQISRYFSNGTAPNFANQHHFYKDGNISLLHAFVCFFSLPEKIKMKVWIFRVQLCFHSIDPLWTEPWTGGAGVASQTHTAPHFRRHFCRFLCRWPRALAFASCSAPSKILQQRWWQNDCTATREQRGRSANNFDRRRNGKYIVARLFALCRRVLNAAGLRMPSLRWIRTWITIMKVLGRTSI